MSELERLMHRMNMLTTERDHWRELCMALLKTTKPMTIDEARKKVNAAIIARKRENEG